MILPPVNPLPENLPLNDSNWSWENFEAFCHDLISQFGTTKNANRYGRKGDFQRGIDIIAEQTDRTCWVFQCKRYKTFTAAEVRTAIEKATYKADRYILLLSCEASSTVIDEITKHPNWECWDLRNISSKVRYLKSDISRNLVTTHFGKAWCKAFLGLSGLETFVSSKTFFQTLLDYKRLFHHCWSLVGRKSILEELHRFIDSDNQKIAIFTGIGGSGKSKLLYHFAKEFEQHHPDWELRFVMNESITVESLDELLTQPNYAIIIDDAHRKEGLSNLFNYIKQRSQNQKFKLIFSSRPQGLSFIESSLTGSDFDQNDITKLGNLEPLNYDEIKELAQQSLGNKYEDHARLLAQITKDCPLITVIAGQLVAQDKIHPSLLEQNDKFRESVLNKFQQEILGKISDHIPSDKCQQILQLISAMAPIPQENSEFYQIASQYLDIKVSQLKRYIGILLENTGILLRTRNKIRITPDILSDHILATACWQGFSTSYIQEIFKLCESHSEIFYNFLVNVSGLDWRIRQVNQLETKLLDEVWNTIEQQYQQLSNREKYYFLDNLNKVAYYQPKRVRTLIKFALNNKEDAEEVNSLRLTKIPTLLRMVGYTIYYLPYCCDLLWEIGKQDNRALNPYPDHALRILQDLAKYEKYKGLETQQIIIDAVSRWLTRIDNDNYYFLALNILDEIFKKEFEYQYTENRTIQIQIHPLNPEFAPTIRSQALKLIEKCLSLDIKIIIRALQSLENALREPQTISGNRNEERCEKWVSEQLTILKIIEELVNFNHEPIIHLKVVNILDWYIHRGYSQQVREKALYITQCIPDTDDLRLVGFMINHEALDWLINNKGQFDFFNPDWYSQICKRVKAIAEEYCQEIFLQKYKSSQAIIQKINQKCLEIENADQCTDTFYLKYPFLDCLVPKIERQTLVEICEATLENPSSPIANYFGFFCSHLRRNDLDTAIHLIQLAIDNGSVPILLSIATSYYFWSESLRDKDISLLSSLLSSDNLDIKGYTINSIGRIASEKPNLMKPLILNVDIGNNLELAKHLCGKIGTTYGLSSDYLSNNEVELLLKKLVTIPEISDHEIENFLAIAFKHNPLAVIQFLLDRIRYRKVNELPSYNYTPIPYQDAYKFFVSLPEPEAYSDILRQVRDKIFDGEGERYFIPILFHALSMVKNGESSKPYYYEDENLTFSSTSLEILEEWINSEDAEKIKEASYLLSKAPRSLILEQVDFISNLASRADEISQDCFLSVLQNLPGVSWTGAIWVTPQQPIPELIQFKDECLKIAETFLPLSASRRCYEELAKVFQKTNDDFSNLDIDE
jgi:hypothetical protein